MRGVRRAYVFGGESMKMHVCVMAALLSGAAAAPAMALEFSFAPFNQLVVNAGGGLDPAEVQLLGVPPGLYTEFSVSLAWSAAGGDPWSDEAIFAFTSAPFGTPGIVFYGDPGASPDSDNNGDAVTLTWAGTLDVPYQGGDTLYFLMAQNFSGSSANWNNIQITLLPAPGSVALLALGGLVASRRRRA